MTGIKISRITRVLTKGRPRWIRTNDQAFMAERVSISDPALPMMTVEEVNRVLEVGRILLAILTSEELDQLRQTMSNRVIDELNISS